MHNQNQSHNQNPNLPNWNNSAPSNSQPFPANPTNSHAPQSHSIAHQNPPYIYQQQQQQQQQQAAYIQQQRQQQYYQQQVQVQHQQYALQQRQYAHAHYYQSLVKQHQQQQYAQYYQQISQQYGHQHRGGMNMIPVPHQQINMNHNHNNNNNPPPMPKQIILSNEEQPGLMPSGSDKRYKKRRRKKRQLKEISDDEDDENEINDTDYKYIRQETVSLDIDSDAEEDEDLLGLDKNGYDKNTLINQNEFLPNVNDDFDGWLFFTKKLWKRQKKYKHLVTHTKHAINVDLTESFSTSISAQSSPCKSHNSTQSPSPKRQRLKFNSVFLSGI